MENKKKKLKKRKLKFKMSCMNNPIRIPEGFEDITTLLTGECPHIKHCPKLKKEEDKCKKDYGKCKDYYQLEKIIHLK